MSEGNLGTALPADPDRLAALIAQGRRDYLRGQKLLSAARNAEKRLRRRGHDLTPEINAQRESLERQLDAIAASVRHAEAMLAARTAKAGGDLLTPAQAERLLLAIKASDASLALFRAEPEETTAMLNRLFTSLDGEFETKLGLIMEHMC